MISDRLKNVILRELHLDSYEIHANSTAAMIPGWDSLSHVRIIMAIEEEYGIRFRTMEVIRLKNVGDLQLLIDRKAI